MPDSLDILKERYLHGLKENPEPYIGIELEFPIVNLQGGKTDIAVSRGLLQHLAENFDFDVERCDRDGLPIQLKSRTSQDRLLFELSYNTLEIAFEKVSSIQEAEERFESYLQLIQRILRKSKHELQGWGLHPFWQENDNRPVRSPRYEMLMNYLALSREMHLPRLHDFPQYGAFICGNQVQLDVSRDNYLTVINVFNQIESAKAYLFANSEFWGQDWDTRISRDVFWEDSMHGLLPENVGVNPYDFTDEEDFFSYLNRSAIFTAQRGEQTFYFRPIPAQVYLEEPVIEAYDLGGEKQLIQPEVADFKTHRSYQYQDLTTRGTIEFRSTCTQPLDLTFTPIAFHVGILAQLDAVRNFLESCEFFREEGRDYKMLRRQFSRKELPSDKKRHIETFSRELLELATAGLKSRGRQEESYLAPLLKGK